MGFRRLVEAYDIPESCTITVHHLSYILFRPVGGSGFSFFSSAPLCRLCLSGEGFIFLRFSSLQLVVEKRFFLPAGEPRTACKSVLCPRRLKIYITNALHLFQLAKVIVLLSPVSPEEDWYWIKWGCLLKKDSFSISSNDDDGHQSPFALATVDTMV